MRKLRLICAAALLVSATSLAATAQERSANIRAGEHPTYSRLVIPGANELAWELRSFGREATLRIPSDAIAYLTDEIFDRIPRSRLLGITAEAVSGDTFLRLQLNCDCDVSAKADGNSLILDISDEVVVQTTDPSPDDDLASNRPLPRPDSENPFELEAVATQPPPSDLAMRLISQLNKAAEQGLIELNEPPEAPSTPDNAPEAPPVDVADAPGLGLQPVEESLDGLEGVADRLTQNLSDALGSSVRIQLPQELELPQDTPRAIREAPSPGETTDEFDSAHCIDDELLDVAYWADERPYSEQVASLQARVFGEFDEVDNDAVLELARFYIYFGLGTETASLLEDLKLDQPQSDLLLELANTVEGKQYKPGGILDKAAGCPGAVTLWRTAAIDTTEEQPLSDPDALLDYFADLPIQVRRIIGPRLVQSFLNRGQQSVANQVFAIVERAAGYHGDAHELRRADLMHLKGAFAEAEQLYWKLVHENSETSAQAAVLLIESLLERDAPIPPNVLTALDALAFEFRDSDEGHDLILTSIKAKAGSNKIEDAIKLSLEEIRENPKLSEAYFGAIDTILSNATTQEMGPTEYLTMIFENEDTVFSQSISDQTKSVIAKEMLKAGLPNTSLEIVDAMTPSESVSTKETVAEAAVKLGQHEAVIRLHQANPENAVLSQFAAKAYNALGQNRQAAETIAENEDLDVAPELHWRAANWDEAAKGSTGPIKILANYMANRQAMKFANTDLDLAINEDAVSQTLSPPSEVTLKYANGVQVQSSTIRNFLTEIISEM